MSSRGTLPYALKLSKQPHAGSRPIVHFIRALNINAVAKFFSNSLKAIEIFLYTLFSAIAASKEEDACPWNATCVRRRGEGAYAHANLSPYRRSLIKYTPPQFWLPSPRANPGKRRRGRESYARSTASSSRSDRRETYMTPRRRCRIYISGIVVETNVLFLSNEYISKKESKRVTSVRY